LLNEEIRYPVFSNNSWATLGTVGEDRTFLVTVGGYEILASVRV